jgi:hypothetical protein
MGEDEWAVVNRLSERLYVPHETVLRMLLTDGLRLRAAREAQQDALWRVREAADLPPIARLSRAVMVRIADLPSRELHLARTTEGFCAVIPGRDAAEDETLLRFPDAIVDGLLAELRYRCGTDILSDDIEVRGDLSVERDDGARFRIEATFPPAGRADGLAAVLRAVPEPAGQVASTTA